jgi:uncharacterized protein (TIGR02147 family)
LTTEALTIYASTNVKLSSTAKTIPEVKSFRLYLQGELIKRCGKNSGYSLRSFAKALQINPASLSRILSGERAVSEKMRDRLGMRLGLSPRELNSFSISSNPILDRKKKAYDFQQISEDSFNVISDWYHYAILELIHLKNFQPHPRWIAKTLGITTSEVSAAVERLCRLQLLKISSEKKWTSTFGNNTNISSDLKKSAYRKLQKQLLTKALEALDEIPLEIRDQSSMTMSISLKRLPEAIEKITDFRRSLCAFLEQDKERDDVYQLLISLYPLTKTGGGKFYEQY